MKLKFILAIFFLLIIFAISLFLYNFKFESKESSILTVKKIIDGDTIEVGSKTIRLALINTPERGHKNFTAARDFLEKLCPVGSRVVIDEDDKQEKDSYGRIVAVVYCNEINANFELLKTGLAKIQTDFCSKSEFGNDEWSKKFGC